MSYHILCYVLYLCEQTSCATGTMVPPQATLVFDVLLEDIHNPKDNITIEQQEVPEPCTRRSVVGDYIRYHYNGTFLNGVTFDTRWAQNLSLGYVSLRSES